MINQIKLFFEQHLALSFQEISTEQQLQLASVALFMEMMVMDDICQAAERTLILSLVQKSFSITSEQAEILIASAEEKRKQAVDYYEFVSLINKQCSLEQKMQFIESLWRIAYADGVVDPQEEYLVRKIADLLYIPHTDFIKLKFRANPIK
jgi:uncharacterized tellurite resistance protein B-like protein